MGNSSGKPVIFTNEVNLNHFRLLRVVGKGAFGKVRIVERKDTGLTFALKYIRKDEVVRSESVKNIIRERRMLEHLNHAFLCNLRYSFQDIEYIYIVVDLMNGGDLRFHISRKTFTEDAVRFWMAELGCALRYVHNQGICHRDLKPDNVLLDSDGHVHLADFNVASDFTPNRPMHSKSGTMAYLAPEVYEGKGYFSEVDWWSLGVTFYECIYNKRPFEARHHEELGEEIKKANPKYLITQPPVSIPCVNAMRHLMEKDRSKRIGAISFESFTDDPFFQPLDFYALERKQIAPIFRPSSDKTNFDATYDLEELLLEEAPLEARARRQKPRPELKENATEQEIREERLHQMIEQMFEPFDYTAATFDRIHETGSSTDALQTNHSSSDPSQSSGQYKKSMEQGGDSTGSYPALPVHEPRRSAPGTPAGSPPLRVGQDKATPPSDAGYFPPDGHMAGTTTPPPGVSFSRPLPQQQPEPMKQAPTSHPSPNTGMAYRPRGATRSTSKGGGFQVVLDEAGSWSDLANQSSTNIDPADAYKSKPSGMLGFLSRKRGRERSPKPQEPGVLGKEGARVVIG
ncbi:MAG: hypothetical protein M1834_008959 [Cirrosporium novae-zelandiae]|nr:MAG: hypothetical protein M1834_008959 [Cirrosporium novae-zelandiae]